MRGGFSPPASRCQLSRPPAKTGKHAALRKDCRTQPKPGEVDQETVLSPLSRSIGVLPPARFRVLPQTGGSRYPLSRDTVETPSLRALHQESRTQPACPRHGLSSSGTTSHAPDTAAPGNRAATPGARQPIPAGRQCRSPFHPPLGKAQQLHFPQRGTKGGPCRGHHSTAAHRRTRPAHHRWHHRHSRYPPPTWTGGSTSAP